MDTIKEDERIKPRFFHRMKKNTNKEEIFALIDEKNLGSDWPTRIRREIRISPRYTPWSERRTQWKKNKHQE